MSYSEDIDNEIIEQTSKKIDKRKETSKRNMEKARLKKLELLKQQREEKQYEYELSSSDESSESDNEIIIKPRRKKVQQVVKQREVIRQQQPQIDYGDQIQDLQQIVYQLAINQKMKRKKTKSKPKAKKVIQIMPPQQKEKSVKNELTEGLKNSIIRF